MLLVSSGLGARRFFHSIFWMKYSPSNNSCSMRRRPLSKSETYSDTSSPKAVPMSAAAFSAPR